MNLNNFFAITLPIIEWSMCDEDFCLHCRSWFIFIGLESCFLPKKYSLRHHHHQHQHKEQTLKMGKNFLSEWIWLPNNVSMYGESITAENVLNDRAIMTRLWSFHSFISHRFHFTFFKHSLTIVYCIRHWHICLSVYSYLYYMHFSVHSSFDSF